MSLRTSHVYLSFFFLLTLISCKDPTDIGVNLPGQNQLGTHFEVQTVQASTVIHPDSILAFRNEPIAVGKVSDGVFGTIMATHYTEIDLNGTGVSFDPGTNPNPSLELILAYSGTSDKTGFYYGDTTVSVKLNVYKLSENFQENKTYYTKDKVATESALLGTITFDPQPNRTAANKNRTITIPLDQAFASQLLTKSFANQEDFRTFWKGIAIAPDPLSPAGSIIGFTTIPDSAGTKQPINSAGINLKYTGADGKIKTHTFVFGGQYFNGLEITRQGVLTTLDKPTKELPAAESNFETYIQANTGVKTRLVFPGLENFKANKGDVFINHAELIIPLKKGSLSAKNPVTPAPSTIFLYESKLNNRIVKTSGGTAISVQAGNAPANGIANPAIGNLIPDSLHYSVNITSYVQALINKQKSNNGIIITPTAEDILSAQGASQAFPGTINLKRALIDATDKKIKLRIYYSKLQ